MSQLTTNTTAFIESEQYSAFILDNLHDYLLPEGMWRDVTDFSSGTTLNIKTVGTVTLQEAAEDTPLTYNPIDTGNITLTITDYVGDAWKVSDDLREEGSQVDSLMSMRAMESTRAVCENHETRLLATCEAAQTAGNIGPVNGRPHRWIAGGAGVTPRKIALTDFIAMKLSFDKAGAPAGGRIAIVDPVCEATLNSLTQLVNVSNIKDGLIPETAFIILNVLLLLIFIVFMYVIISSLTGKLDCRSIASKIVFCSSSVSGRSFTLNNNPNSLTSLPCATPNLPALHKSPKKSVT